MSNKTPNAETQEAIEEARKGNVETAIDADDLIRQLNEIEENKMLWEQIECMTQTNLALVKKLEELR